ncbi:MAG: protein-glutamate O-methyltransferase CheR [Plectolyngbya sp. WJT66-NPBG17]|jgi:chemotaxis protein methyltransferase CheR|nr:protein-glutamate O-methyltransferase CheR [Plectolyngbya sp. WJT66-NPBG17]MBW4527280.1 protein-glutamate O-methyltransferase CheR [Phormidium tanganyikae FI6-MK23]
MSSLPFDFDYLRQLVQQQSAVVLGAEKRYLADLHLGAVAERAGFSSIAALVEKLKQSPVNELHIQVVEALLTNETSFFRDHYPFEALKNAVIPQLIQQRWQERSLTIWCAACSYGQEPYSIAILIREHFPELATWNLQLIASDFSGRALARFKQGCYSQLEINRGLSPTLRDKYFHKHHESWQISDALRQMVMIRQLNLTHDWKALPQFDIIFLRNILIYFDIETKRSILQKTHQHLRSDGYLFLGGGEAVFNINDKFESVRIDHSIYHRLRSL